MSKESTFDKDTTDMQNLRKVLLTMVDELDFDRRKDERLTVGISVKIRHTNFDTHTKQAKLPYTSSDNSIALKVMELFNCLYSRWLMIRLIGIKFSELISGGMQIDLFNVNIELVSLN